MRILELAIDTGPLEEQRTFYSSTLGLPVLDETSAHLVVAAGATRLELRAAPPGTDPTYHIAFGIPTNLFAEAKGWLAGRTPLLREEGEDELYFAFWNADACYAADPAGNVLELIALHDFGIERSAPFGPEAILGVMEVGLPVPDVLAAVAELGEVFGLGPRRGATPRADFTAVGEDDGCLIVVPVGRRWALGDSRRPAAPYPLELAFAGPVARELRPEGLPYRLRAIPASGS
jgi:catechol 2,3-dioxygenase-like lactoylglutathione lyase family enzyme